MSKSVVKWGEGLSNRVSIMIEDIRSYEVCCLYGCFITFFYSFVSILYHCIYGGMLCMLPFNFVNHVFFLLCYVFLLLCYAFLLLCSCILLLCIFRFGYYVSLCCSVYCCM